MSNGFTPRVSKLHNRLAQVVGPLRGRLVRKADIHLAWISIFPELEDELQWIILSDHCINKTNEGACLCAVTELALFEHIERGVYRVL